MKTKLVQRYIAHVTRDSDTTFKVKRSKVNLQGAYCGGLLHSLFVFTSAKEVICVHRRQLVCLFVSGITQKLLDRFSQHSLESWHTGQVRNL